MEPQREAVSPTVNPTTSHAANHAGETPLRRYLAALDQGGEGQQLLRHIHLYVVKANLAGEQSTHEIALEIMQELVVEALRAEGNFDGTRSPRPWLLGIAVNLIKRRREKLFRQRETLASDLDLAVPGRITGIVTGRTSGKVSGELTGEITEEQLFDRLAGQIRSGPEQEVLAEIGIDELLSPLAPAERRIIELSVLHDLNGAEIARELGITPGNVRVRCHRVLAKLRTLWLAQETGREEKQSHG
jgi:RNA polymerase sigma factor (sigma-70 family)